MGFSDSFDPEIIPKDKGILKLELHASVIEQERKKAVLVFSRDPVEKLEIKI